MEAWTPTEDTVQFLIGRFALPYGGGVLTPVARGSMGQIWRLDLVEPTVDDTGVAGDRLMVKEFFWGADEDAEGNARAEADFCRAAATAGIELTQGCRAIDGTYVQRRGGAVVRLNTWAAGRAVRPADSGRAEYLGRTLGTLHALRYPADAEPDPYFTTPPSEDAWAELLEQVAAAPDRIPHPARMLPGRVPDLVALGGYIDSAPQRDLIFSHRDVKPENVLREESSGRMTLIDWDEAGSISPSRELASQLCVWHIRDGTVHQQDIRRTVRAYHAAGGYGAVNSLAAFSLRLANDLNYIHGEVLAALEEDLPEDMRKHAEREAEKFIRTAPTRALLEQVIEAAAP